DIHFYFTTDYKPRDKDCNWVFSGAYQSRNFRAGSKTLRRIHSVAYHNEDGLGVDAEVPLGLAYAALVIRCCLSRLPAKRFPNKNGCVGIAFGFDEGDRIKLGELTHAGLE